MIGRVLAGLACLGASGPAIANTIASPVVGTTIYANGTLNVNIFGLGNVKCNAFLTGSVTNAGSATTPGQITFTSGFFTNTPSSTQCGINKVELIFPIVIKSTSYTLWTIDTLTVSSPLSQCFYYGIYASRIGMDNIQFSNAASGPCSTSLSLLTSPSISINP